jgi:hypothetical protein
MNLFKIIMLIIIMDINYLSDDEQESNINSKNRNDDYMPYDSEEDEEMDDEEIEYLRQQNIIIMNALNNKTSDYNEYYVEKEKVKKHENPKEIKKNKSMNMGEFHNYINDIIKEKQPKKFVSSRFLEKKKLTETNSNTCSQTIENNKRTFNPRLPPYFEVHQRYNKY